MSHVKLHFALLTSHCTLHTPHFTLHTSHFTLLTALFTLHTSRFTLHTSHCTLHSSHSTLLTSHCFLHTPHFTLHTPHCTLRVGAKNLQLALRSRHMLQFPMSTFARVFLERYSDELAAEQMETMAVWEEELCKHSAADCEAARPARAAALVGVQVFFAKFAAEIVQLQKQNLRDVVRSNQAYSYAEWMRARIFFVRHHRLLTVKERDLLEDWELVLCDAPVAFLPRLERSFGRAKAFVVEHSDQLKLQNKKASVDIFESKDCNPSLCLSLSTPFVGTTDCCGDMWVTCFKKVLSQFVRDIPAAVGDMKMLLIRRCNKDPHRKQRVPFLVSRIRLERLWIVFAVQLTKAVLWLCVQEVWHPKGILVLSSEKIWSNLQTQKRVRNPSVWKCRRSSRRLGRKSGKNCLPCGFPRACLCSWRRVSRMVPEQPFFRAATGRSLPTRCLARMWHRAVRKDRHEHVQLTMDVDAPLCRQKRHTRKTSVLPSRIQNVALLNCDGSQKHLAVEHNPPQT